MIGGATMEIYLDNAATTRLSDSMKQYLVSILDIYGNPSSLHSVGTPAEQILSDARQAAADFIHADPSDTYFTGGGSASNTLAIRGYCEGHTCTLLYSPIAHKSLLRCAESCPNRHALKVDHEGRIDIPDLEAQLNGCVDQPFVMIDHANSEIGVVQDVEALIQKVHAHHGIVYLDCTGSIPQIPIDAKALDADMLGFSAHKLGGLKGCGVLYKKKNIALEPLIYGSQENGLVGGTENVLGIASLAKAVKEHDYASISPEHRDYVYNYITKNIPDSYLVGASIASGNRLPHNLYMCFHGVEGESLMFLLDMNGIQVSTGSACNSGSLSASAALSAIGMSGGDLHSCIRLTFSGTETIEEMNYVCDKLKQSVAFLRRLNPYQDQTLNRMVLSSGEAQ